MVPSQLKAQLEATFCSVVASHENTMLTAARKLMCPPISVGPVTKPQEPLTTPSSKARKPAQSVTPQDPATTPKKTGEAAQTVISLCQSPPVPAPLVTPGKASRKRGLAATESGVRKSFRLATAKAVLSSKVIMDEANASASLAESDDNSDVVVTGPKRNGQRAPRAVVMLVSDSDGGQPVTPSPGKRKPEPVRLPPLSKRQAQHTPVPLSVDSPAGTPAISADSLLASIGLLQERACATNRC